MSPSGNAIFVCFICFHCLLPNIKSLQIFTIILKTRVKMNKLKVNHVCFHQTIAGTAQSAFPSTGEQDRCTENQFMGTEMQDSIKQLDPIGRVSINDNGGLLEAPSRVVWWLKLQEDPDKRKFSYREIKIIM
jgi:hypothetical protein